MKRRLILENENYELLKESSSYIEQYKIVFSIDISFIESEDIKLLKKLNNEIETIQLDLKIVNKYLEEDYDLKELLSGNEEYLILNNSINDLNRKKDIVLSELNIYEEELEFINFKDFSEEEHLLYLQYKKITKELFILNEEARIISDKLTQEARELSNEKVEEQEELKRKLKDFIDKEEELSEKISLNKTKTNEEIFEEITNATTEYKTIKNIEIPDDGKFNSKIEHFIKINGKDWEKNENAGKDITTIEELLEFLNISKNKSIDNLIARKNIKLKRIEKELSVNPAVKHLLSINKLEVERLKTEKRLFEYEKKSKMLLKNLDKQLAEYEKMSNSIKRKYNELEEKISGTVTNIKDTVKRWFKWKSK